MRQNITEFEYTNIKREVDYYCKYYNIVSFELNSDFIFSNALFNYIKYKQKVDFLNNEKIICSVIRTISKRAVLKYIFKNINYSCAQINDDIVDNNNTFENHIKKELFIKLDLFISLLNEKEQALFDLLINDINKNKACIILKISREEYDSFIIKVKRLVIKYL